MQGLVMKCRVSFKPISLDVDKQCFPLCLCTDKNCCFPTDKLRMMEMKIKYSCICHIMPEDSGEQL